MNKPFVAIRNENGQVINGAIKKALAFQLVVFLSIIEKFKGYYSMTELLKELTIKF